MSPNALVDRYAEGGPILAYAAQGLTPEQATARPGPGVWSIAELAAHLADCDAVFSDRIRRVIAEEDPPLLAFEENRWMTRLYPKTPPLDDAVGLFVSNRRWTTSILRGVGEADFARAGTHSETGRKTLAEIVVYAANHLDHHLKFLYGKRGNMGISLYPRFTHSPAE